MLLQRAAEREGLEEERGKSSCHGDMIILQFCCIEHHTYICTINYISLTPSLFMSIILHPNIIIFRERKSSKSNKRIGP